MADQADDAIAVAKPAIPLWRKARAWAVIVAVYAMLLGLAYGGVVRMDQAFRRGIGWDDRVWIALTAAALLAAPGWLVWFFVKQRWTTGRWVKSKEERLQSLTQCRVQSKDRRSAQFSWVSYTRRWAEFSARDTNAPLWKRVAGWVVVAGFATVLLGLGALGVICFGAAFDESNTLMQGFGWCGFGAGLLMIPGVFVLLLRRRKRDTGSYWTSREELAEMAGRKQEWERREREKPLGSKISSIVVALLALAYLWRHEFVLHPHQSHGDWLTPAMWTCFAAYFVWVQFRRPKEDRV